MGEEKVAPPPGVRPIWIQMKNYELYGLREEGAESGNMTALVPFVLLNRARLLEEVAKFGFMCDWNDFKVCLPVLRVPLRVEVCEGNSRRICYKTPDTRARILVEQRGFTCLQTHNFHTTAMNARPGAFDYIRWPCVRAYTSLIPNVIRSLQKSNLCVYAKAKKAGVVARWFLLAIINNIDTTLHMV